MAHIFLSSTAWAADVVKLDPSTEKMVFSATVRWLVLLDVLGAAAVRVNPMWDTMWAYYNYSGGERLLPSTAAKPFGASFRPSRWCPSR